MYFASCRYCGVVDTTGQRLNSKWLVLEASYAAPELLDKPMGSRYGYMA